MKLYVNWIRLLAAGILILAVAATALFGHRTSRSLQFLRSANEVGAPRTSGIRGWMTLKYVSTAYRVSELSLSKGLELPPDTDMDRSLKSLADEARIPRPQYVQRVQRVIAERGPVGEAERENASSSWFGAIADRVLTWLLISGYAAPRSHSSVRCDRRALPAGMAMALAGSLAVQGRLDWKWAGAIAVIASVLGAFAGYGLSRMLSQEVLESVVLDRLSSARHASVHKLSIAGACSPCSSRGPSSISQFDREPFRRRESLSSFQVPGSCGDRAAAMDCGLYGPWISCRRRPGSSCQLPDKSQPLVLDSGGLRRLGSARVPAHGRCGWITRWRLRCHPSRRQSSAMLSSPRSPSSTMRIFSSAEKCRRVACRTSFDRGFRQLL